MKKPSEIKQELTALLPSDSDVYRIGQEQSAYEPLLQAIKEYQKDERAQVTTIVAQFLKQLNKRQIEYERLVALSAFEQKYPDCDAICGVDEVGRGPLAGPVVAGAVILPKGVLPVGINDSKQVSEKKREALYTVIEREAVSCAVGSQSSQQIDEMNILQATYEAMRIAIAKLTVSPQLLLNDAVHIPQIAVKQVSIVHGDALSISIGAASIYAKVTRDHLMVAYDKQYPGYGFASNKGYGSAEHIAYLKQNGPTPIHRRSFIGNFIHQ